MGWYIYKYNGMEWKSDSIDIKIHNELNSVYFTDINYGWAVGDSGYILKYNGKKWITQKTDLYNYILTSVYFTDTINGWAIGSSTIIYGDIILKYNGKKWIEYYKVPYKYWLSSLFFLDSDNGWAVGGYYDWNNNWQKHYAILKYDGKQWAVQDSGTAYNYLYSVFFTDKNNGWAVGEEGTILKFNGKDWKQQESPINTSLRSVYFTDTMNGWAVGEDGVILKFNEKKWRIDAKENAGFRSVYFTDKNNGWAGGSSIYKYTSPGFTVSGQMLYGGRADKPLTGITVYLVDAEGVKINKTVSDSIGFYKFEFIEPGDYSLQCETKEAWGGSDPVDALLCNKYFLKMYNFDSPLHKVAADVNTDNIVNPIDALYINRRFIHLLDKFNKADWLFENPHFTISNSDIKLNINALCTGDPNASK